MSSADQKNVPLAIGLTFAAGLSTVIGASISFCIKPHQVEILPIALAFSAGVMIYVSMVEIMTEALHSFQHDLESKHPNSFELLAHIYLSLVFFGGIAVGYVLDAIVHCLGHKHNLLSAEDIAQPKNKKQQSVQSQSVNPYITTSTNDNEDNEECDALRVNDTNKQSIVDQESKELIKTSLTTALTIALHNFPEGLATFVSTLADPALGVSIAVAIAIHNIPEGIAVAVPIYFATESKIKAFFWAFMSGIAEPIGGLVGWAVINNAFNDSVYGVLFGFTGGLMVYISFKELLPTARKRDTKDKYTTILLFAGFLVMDISLILFEI